MKTILVPTEQHDLLTSTLQTALLLARKFDSYIEGFALFPAMIELYALDSGVPLPIEVKEHDAEMAKQARSFFETFMNDHGVARSKRADASFSFDWLDAAPDGDAFVGTYGRVFDVIVLGRAGAGRRSRPSLATIEAAAIAATTAATAARFGVSAPGRSRCERSVTRSSMAVPLSLPSAGPFQSVGPSGRPHPNNTPVCQISEIFLSLAEAKFYL